MPPALVVDIEPMGAPRMTRADAWRARAVVLRYFKFKDDLRTAAAKKKYEMPDELYLTFVISMPQSWTIKKRDAMLGKEHKSKPDLDNLFKACTDCLKKNDQSIHTTYCKKVWGNSGKIIFYETLDSARNATTY